MITNLYLEYLSHRNNQSQVQSLTQAPQDLRGYRQPQMYLEHYYFWIFQDHFYLEAICRH